MSTGMGIIMMRNELNESDRRTEQTDVEHWHHRAIQHQHIHLPIPCSLLPYVHVLTYHCIIHHIGTYRYPTLRT